ncbi:hypothetical protein GCU68_09350 [Natronorubrum aibiense]|uniref:Uncharacterized protein n=1 Tax=Natronorubrum aibiense TaxID=348826 RepID=A0A5P9P3S8_9EURY|nr:hypothetical protein [Natronorubrum aibiense]QFU82716.1 hypothetical protein GCU68_09350 [Natronorubrum aibiense]
MTLDRHAAERRRFARLLGMDGEAGCGLPIGSRSSHADSDAGSDSQPPETPSSTNRSVERQHRRSHEN